jgi:hypothetical protein
MDKEKRKTVLEILKQCWSLNSSSRWTSENPARGQCGVTALVIQDVFSGDILKTKVDKEWHYYNFIDGERVDFTESQYPISIYYSDNECKRIEAVLDTELNQYLYLSTIFRNYIKNYPGLVEPKRVLNIVSEQS